MMKETKDLFFIKESYAGNSVVPAVSWELYQNRTILLTGTITAESSIEFLIQLDYLKAMDGEDPVRILIHSPGGSVPAGLAIYDAIRSFPYPLDIICVGEACSMAAVLLAAGEKGHRFVTEHSCVMIHEVRMENVGSGSVSGIEEVCDRGKYYKDTINDILAKHTGKTINQIKKATTKDYYMNAKQAIAFGIADKIL